LERLIQQAARAGGQEVRLIPGRRIVILTPAGEREVQGPPQSAESVAQMVDGVATDASRQALAAGKAEWRIEVTGVGGATVSAEKRAGGVNAVVRLDNGPEVSPEPAIAVAAAAPAPRRRALAGPTGEMDELFTTLFDMNASDLHLSVGAPPMVRHDGEIKALPGRAVLSAVDTERMLFPIAPERNREEFGRRNDTDFAYEVPGVARFRCNFFRDRKGIGGVFRVIPSKIMTAEEMGLSKEILQLCSLPKGLVLVTGPTGSGKSTTLCALIDYINRNRTDHIITIEDPIEFVHENKKCLINQRQVGEHTVSFKDALRAALREDPDIVLVGEMRDLETVAIAIETAETGGRA
jgi:twitching motility protein PilT